MGFATVCIESPFKNEYVSVSRLKLYEKCPLAFKAGYIDGARRVSGAAADEGKVVHKAFELIFRWVIQEEFIGKVPEHIILDAYNEAFAKSGHDVNPNHPEEVKYGQGSVGLDVYQDGLALVRNHFRLWPMVNHWTVLAVEQPIKMMLGKHELRGFIDQAERIDDTTLLIRDWKSNRMLFRKAEMDADLQMSAYGLAAKQLWPWAKEIRYVYQMLRHNKAQYTQRTEGALQEAKDYIISLTERIESALAFEAKLNPLCPWCEHRESCGEYSAALKKGEQTLSYLVTAGDIDKICSERYRAHVLEKIAKKRKEEMDVLLTMHLHQLVQIVSGGQRFTLSQNADTVYPVDSTVKELAAGLGIPDDVVASKIVSVRSAAVTALLKEAELPSAKRKLLQAKIEALAERLPWKPYVNMEPAHKRR